MQISSLASWAIGRLLRSSGTRPSVRVHLTNCYAANKCVFAVAGKASDAVPIITSGLTALRSTLSTNWMPLYLSYWGIAYAELHRFDDACRCLGEAMTAVETTKERWFEAEANRIAGEIALRSPEPDATKARDYFERALAIARQQQA